MMNFRCIKPIVTIFFVVYTITAFAQKNAVQEKLDTYCSSNPKLSYTQVGVSVRDVSQDSLIASYNGNKSMIPASLVKLYSTSAALSTLTPEHSFKTTIGYVGTIHKGELRGSIIIIGGGDPTLGSKHFPESKNFIDTIIAAIKKKGITSINGKIILDCSMYDKESIPRTWVWDDFGKDYASGVYPLSLYDNNYQITLQSGSNGDTAKVKQVFPQNASGMVQSQVTSAKRDTNFSAPQIQGNIDDFSTVITGNIPENHKGYTIRGAMSSPPDVFGLEIRQALFRANMVKYNQDYIVSYAPVPLEQFDTILVLQSPDLFRMVGIVNYFSNNSYAEHIYKYMGYHATQKGTFDESAKIVYAHFKDLGVSAKGVAVYDGSGLSRFNSTTANHMTDFLSKVYIKNGADSSAFYRSLPISGKYGTLRSYGFPNYLIGKVQGKTGSMTRVRNLSGYVTTKSGKKVAFCVMLNGFIESDGNMRDVVIEIVDIIYQNY